MTEGEVLVSGGEASENGEFIFKRLPPWMPRTESDGNFKLLDVVGRGFDRLDGDIDEIDKETTIQNAEKKQSIREIAKLVDEVPKQGEGIEEYRLRVIASFQKLTTEGTLDDIFGNIATLLEISVEDITYEDLEANGEILLGVPGSAIKEVALTQQQFSEVLKEQSAAGYKIEVKSEGTFTYITPFEYNNNAHDATLGFDGLDSNGEPKENGGTYAGVLS